MADIEQRPKVDFFSGVTGDGRVVHMGFGMCVNGEEGYQIMIDSHHGETKIALTPETMDALVALRKDVDRLRSNYAMVWKLIAKISDVGAVEVERVD